jgi:hypothetical protein
MALYQRAEQYVKEALEASNASQALESKLCTCLQTLRHDIEGQVFSAHAHSVLEDEGIQDEEGGYTQAGTKTYYRSKKVCIVEAIYIYVQQNLTGSHILHIS